MSELTLESDAVATGVCKQFSSRGTNWDTIRYPCQGVVQLRYMFRTGFMSQILSWCEKPGDHYSRWGCFSLPLSLDGMKSRFWMKITFHWSESQVKNPISNFLFVLLKGMTSQTIGFNIGFMPFLLKPVTSCVLLHVSQTPTSVNTIVMLRAWGLWLVLTMLSYEASEEKLKADQSLECRTVEPKKRTPGWFLNRLCA